ncbi:DUF4058 family protein [Okeania sp. SIO2B3]|uniref:DUF4058 family protein n=1 Tax=Okeania sp. SIO2B3 TaxID=2607784 RepID=UPI00342A565D
MRRCAMPKKRQHILSSYTNFVEIDLLRQGNSMITLNQNIEHDYCILVSPNNQRPQAHLYAFNIQDMIPVFTEKLRFKASPLKEKKAVKGWRGNLAISN